MADLNRWTKMESYHVAWRRIGAWLIDTLVIFPALWIGGTYYRYSYGTTIGVVWAVSMLVISSGYFIYFHGRYGQTVGKRLLRIRVVSSKDEGPIGYAVAFRRESPWILWGILGAVSVHWMSDWQPSISSIIDTSSTVWSCADMIAVLTNSKRRALHDFIGGTVVRKAESNQSPETRPTSRPVSA